MPKDKQLIAAFDRKYEKTMLFLIPADLFDSIIELDEKFRNVPIDSQDGRKDMKIGIRHGRFEILQ